MLRILHTSDWHLGHTLHELPRTEEHARFLDWLLCTIEDRRVDALLIAGDVFDTANPPADAQEAFYRFLAQARQRSKHLDIVVIGGNHDSAARLDAPDPILRALGVRVVGGLPHHRGEIDMSRVLVPLSDSDGSIAAWVAAVPFLRPSDLPTIQGSDDPLVSGVRDVYGRILEAARSRLEGDQALVAMGHCYMTGTKLSELSERKILGGNQHALPVDIFPDDVAYAALGHLHLAQKVGGRDSVRYSGSPIPLAIDEERYRHQVSLAVLDGKKLVEVESIEIPRTVPILRIPGEEPRPMGEVIAQIEALPPIDSSLPDWQRPYLEAHVLLEKPEPLLRHHIDEALVGKAARLVRLRVRMTGTGEALGDAPSLTSLKEMSPEEVFRKRYARDHEGEPSPELISAFAELLEIAEGEGR